MLKLIFKIYTLVKYYPSYRVRKVFRKTRNSPVITTSAKHRKILFCPFAPHQLNIIRESIWAHGCRIRGAEVKMITCDLHLPAIDFVSPGVKKDLKVSYWIVKKLYSIIGLPALYLSRYNNISKESYERYYLLDREGIIDLKHKGIELGDLVIASTIRYFFSNGPEWDDPEFMDRARKFAVSAIMLTDIYLILLDDEKPDKIVTSHGIYVSWGTLFRVARERGIPVDVYGASYRKDTLRFYHNCPNAPFPDGEWKYCKELKLSDNENLILDSYVETRSSQKEDSVTLFSEKDHFPDELRDFLQNAKNNNKKVFSLFTNISWDAYMFTSKTGSFESMVEWVNSNISYFSSREDACLIIKAHPSEKYFNVPWKYRIRNNIPADLPHNIYFINESADIKPFNLYTFTDVGLIFTSTVSIEMALRSIPVVTAGKIGQYSNKGFTIDPKSAVEYFKIIDSIIKGTYSYSPNIDMARKYLYFRFFREALKFDLIRVEKYKIKEYHFNSFEGLLPGENKVLDIICDGILNDTKFLN